MDRPKIVCLCGSTHFYDQFKEANLQETMSGHIVLSVGVFVNESEKVHGRKIELTAEEKDKLDELHKRKIDLADQILVINVDGYIGRSTTSEIEYAKRRGIPVRLWS